MIEPAEPPTTSGLPVHAHGAKLPLSSRHSNVTLSSLATQLNVASVPTVVASGPDSIVVTGAVPPAPAPIVQVWTAGVLSTLPETSTARTSKRCSPSARSVSVSGDSHGPKASASSLHWNVMSLTLSVPLKRNTAVSLLLGSAGAWRICVSGGTGSTEIGGPLAHWTIQHCCGSSVIGSSGPMLPWARLPPPSTLLRPLLPSLTQMPQLPLSWALLPLITWARLGDVDAVALVVVGDVALDQAAGRAGRLVADVDAVAVVVARRVAQDLVVERRRGDRHAGALGVAGVVALDHVAGRVLELDAALVEAQVVALDEAVAREVHRDGAVVRAPHDVVEHACCGRTR